jgi:undecaprenyl-diphosphatase
MTNLQIMILSALQGLTEFLPISSSGHLILVSKFTNFPDQGVEMDIAVHVGSVLAILIYFHKDIGEIIKDVFTSYFMPSLKTYGSRLFWLIVIGTIPAVIFGLILHYNGTDWLRDTKIIGWNILIFGIVLWIADNYSPSVRKIDDMQIKDAIIVGIIQSLALIPGTSRSGVTITMARFLGIDRREAAKFSMLLSIPTIIGAGILSAWRIYHRDDWMGFYYSFGAVGYSFIASILVIFFMMNWLKQYSFLPFVIYRILLGTFLLIYSYGYIGYLGFE